MMLHATRHSQERKKEKKKSGYLIRSFSVAIHEQLYIEYAFYELFSSIPLLNYCWGAAFIF